MLLQVMSLTTDVTGHFITIGQANPSNLAQCRVRLLRRRCIHSCAHTTLLRRSSQRRHVRFFPLPDSRFSDQLISRGHKELCRARLEAPSKPSKRAGILGRAVNRCQVSCRFPTYKISKFLGNVALRQRPPHPSPCRLQ